MRALLFVLTFMTSLYAVAEENIDYSIHQDYLSVRALGSGNSFTVIDDYNVLFYNPAGLARLQEGELNFGIGAGVTTSAMGFYKDIEDASKATETEKVTKVQAVLDKNYGKTFGIRAPAGVNAIWARPKWGLGLNLLDMSVNLSIHQVGSPQVAVSAYNDSTLALGLAKLYGEQDSLALGVTLKAIYRGYVGKSFNAFDLATNSSFFKTADAQEGLTVDADLGAQYKVIVPESGFLAALKYAKPTIGLVIHNVADYGFTQNMHLVDKASASNPPKLGRRFDIGSKFELPNFWVFHPNFMFDVRDIGHRHWTFLKGLHTGFELGWKAFSWLQGYYSTGISQGYISAGVGAELVWFRLDAASYGEEIGTSNAKKENRYYIAKMSLDF